MNPTSLAQTAARYSSNATVRTPSVKRLLVFWPRYLRVKGHGNVKTFTTGLSHNSKQEKKAYSTAVELPIPLSGIHGLSLTTEDDSEPARPSTQAQVVDSRYSDPQEYLEDYGIGLPEATVLQWEADLKAYPPRYAALEHEAWLEKIERTPTKPRTVNSLLGDAPEVISRAVGRKYRSQSPWIAGFLQLYAQFDALLDEDVRQPIFLGDSRAPEWSRPFLEADLETQRSFWVNLDGGLASAIWGHVMLYTLYKHPERALEMLSASMFAPRERSAVELVFAFATQYVMTLEGDSRELLFQKLIRFLRNSLQPGHITKHRTFNRAIMTIRREGGPRDELGLYETLVTRGFTLQSWSHLHFAYGLANAGHLTKAVDGLQASIGTASDLSSEFTGVRTGAFRSVCNVVLRKLSAEKSGYRVALQLMSRLAETGLTLTRPLANVMMLNAVEAGDTVTCLGLYRTGVEGGLPRNSFTYEFALRAVRDNGTDEQVQAIVHEAVAYQGDGRIQVLNAVLPCIGAFYGTRSPLTAFQRLLDVYRQHFNLDPLVKLGIVRGRDSKMRVDPSDTTTALLEPDPATIHIMLYCYLESIEGNPTRTWDVWQSMKHLMRWEPLFARCGMDPHFYATFIHHLGRDRSHVKKCFWLLKDMLRPSVCHGGRGGFNPALAAIAPAPPNTIILNTLLHVVTRHRQWGAVEMLKALMKERNIPEDDVTQNTLINAYSRKQDVEQAVAAVREMQQAGFEFDKYTMTGLQQIRDRAALMQALRSTSVPGSSDGIDDSAMTLLPDSGSIQPQQVDTKGPEQASPVWQGQTSKEDGDLVYTPSLRESSTGWSDVEPGSRGGLLNARQPSGHAGNGSSGLGETVAMGSAPPSDNSLQELDAPPVPSFEEWESENARMTREELGGVADSPNQQLDQEGRPAKRREKDDDDWASPSPSFV